MGSHGAGWRVGAWAALTLSSIDLFAARENMRATFPARLAPSTFAFIAAACCFASCVHAKWHAKDARASERGRVSEWVREGGRAVAAG